MKTDFKFNDHVYVEMILGPIEKRSGRLVQIRRGVGAFGMDIYLIRLRDGSLCAFENVILRKVSDRQFEWNFYVSNGVEPPQIPEQPIDPRDHLEDEYFISEKWPEVGFIIENPKQPESDVQTFAMTITRLGPCEVTNFEEKPL